MSVPNPTTPTTPTIQWSWYNLWSYIENKGVLGMDALQKLRKEIVRALFGFWVFVQVAYVIVANKPMAIIVVAPMFLLMAGFLLYHIWNPQLLKWELGIAALTAANDPATVQQTIPGAIRSLQVVFAFGAITYALWIPLAFLIVVIVPVKVAHPEYDLGIAYLIPTMMVFAGMGSLAANIEGKFTLHLGIALGLGIILAISTMLVAPSFPVWIPFVLATGGLLAVFEKGTWKFFVWLFSKKGAFLVIVLLIAWYLWWPTSFKEHQKTLVEEHKSAGTFLGDLAEEGGEEEESQTDKPKTADDAAKRAREEKEAEAERSKPNDGEFQAFKKRPLDTTGCKEIESFPLKPEFGKLFKKTLRPGAYAVTTDGFTVQWFPGEIYRGFWSDGGIMDLSENKVWMLNDPALLVKNAPYGTVTMQKGERGDTNAIGLGVKFSLERTEDLFFNLNMFQGADYYKNTLKSSKWPDALVTGHIFKCN